MNALSFALFTMSAILSSPTETAFVPAMRAVPFTRVTLEDSFWKPRVETNRARTIPHNFKLCDETGRISNFAKAAKRMEGKFEGIYFNDSDVYKVLEGAAYAVASSSDEGIYKKMEEVIDLIAAAQQSDGYLNTYYTLVEPDKRWTDLPVKHELYCAGHLIEAAVAHWNATGSRKFLDVAIRLADHIDSIFGPGKRYGFPGHEELEIALLKLFEVTGEARYKDLAGFFLAARGQGRKPEEEYCQAHAPLVEHTDIVGHAVRAMYLYTAAADWTALTGQRVYLPALERVWRSVTERRMYLTGGIGSKRENEGFSADYDLPNDGAYCETCASIGMALWNHRMLLLHGESRFADVLERVLYNGVLSGVSLDGEKFFYENPLASRGKHHRKPWYDCACCPPNVARFLPTVAGYLYGESDRALWVNLYAAGAVEARVASGTVRLRQDTGFPWSGDIQITFLETPGAGFSLNLRVPTWAAEARLWINGKPQRFPSLVENRYIKVERVWQAGDRVALRLPMEVERVEADPRVRENAGKVALMRGPLVYCLEGVDHKGRARNLFLPRDAVLTTRFEPNLMGGMQILSGRAWGREAGHDGSQLYQPAAGSESAYLRSLPYCFWDNREPGEMVVWIPECEGLAEFPTPDEAAEP